MMTGILPWAVLAVGLAVLGGLVWRLVKGVQSGP
ncbi:hypothetical protein ES705_37398 [subsurface metagenome]